MHQQHDRAIARSVLGMRYAQFAQRAAIDHGVARGPLPAGQIGETAVCGAKDRHVRLVLLGDTHATTGGAMQLPNPDPAG
jgi:hypothetical protein